jgi:hypothetical protein
LILVSQLLFFNNIFSCNSPFTLNFDSHVSQTRNKNYRYIEEKKKEKNKQTNGRILKREEKIIDGDKKLK